MIRQFIGEGAILETDTEAAAWYKGLLTPMSTKAAAKVAEGLVSWADEVLARGSPTDPYRTCFRLEAPPDGGKRWSLEYLVQSVRDPSLIIPAEMVWSEKKSTAQERLLSDLAKGSKFFKPIDRSLESSPAPTRGKLTIDEAYSFLKESAWLLRESGFGVQIPHWLEEGTRLKIQLNVKSPRRPNAKAGEGSIFTISNLAQFDWKIALSGQNGEVILSEEEFMALAALKQPIVEFRGEWVELRKEDVDSAIMFLEKQKKQGGIHMADLVRFASAPESQILPVEIASCDGWVSELIGRLKNNSAESIADIPAPEHFVGTLRPYQLKGFSWLAFMKKWGLGACLADDMGLGKAQPLDARVLTPRGWTSMGETRVGAQVIGKDGKAHCVLGVYPQGLCDIYKLTFSDGSWTECTDNHLWEVWSTNQRFRRSHGSVLELREIRKRTHYTNGNRIHFIPIVEPVEFDATPLEVNPYILGVLLGDANISHESSLLVSSCDGETLKRVTEIVTPLGLRLNKIARSTYDYYTSKATSNRSAPNQLTVQMRKLGLMGTDSLTKFIPENYKLASIADRVALLQGLLDTDGYISEDGVVLQYFTSSPKLAGDVTFLVQSLGGVVYRSTKTPTYWYRSEKRKGSPSHILTISLPPGITPFRLARKLARYRPRSKYLPSRSIESVKFVGKKESQCIRIDSLDGLYVTDDFIVIHNTIQFIALLLRDREKEEPRSKKPTLLICPTSIVGNWKREIEKFSPSITAMIRHGSGRISDKGKLARAVRNCDIVISTYSLIQRDIHLLSEIEWRTVVLDEAQNVKNHWTKQAQAVRKLKSEQRVALTGTPIENRLSELWSIMDFLNPGYLGTFEEFRRKYSVPVERYGDDNTQRVLQKIIQPFILRRLKTDTTIIADLPKKNEMKVFCSLTEEQASLYEAHVAKMLQEIEASEGIQRRGLVLSALTRLKQICDHPALYLADRSSLASRSGKLERLKEMLEEVVEENEKALVFTQFSKMGEMIKNHLEHETGYEVPFLYGGVPRKKRDEMVARFQEDSPSSSYLPVFVISLKAGGLGLNLTAANHVFHYDRWWNPAVENQATDRAFRIGQKKNVQVHKFVSAGTLEEMIDSMIERKKGLAENILGTGEQWLTELSTKELRDVLVLRRE